MSPQPSLSPAQDAAADGDRIARRNAAILAAAQALGGATASIVIATGSLTAASLLPEAPGLATLPISCVTAAYSCVRSAWLPPQLTIQMA